MTLRPAGDAPWPPLMTRFASLPRDTAQRVVRFWRVRHGAERAAA